jgi:hypothetical protein
LPSQQRFHALRARFKGFSGPIGSGKSAALCHEAIRKAYQNPGCMGLLGAPTYPMLRDATQRALVAVLDENELPYNWNRSESFIELTQCGSRILLRSLEEYERLRGTNLAWFGVDELTYCREEAWLRLEGRLREPKAKQPSGFGVWTPKGKDWVHRRFLEATTKDYSVVLAKPSENRHVLATDPDFYERLKSTYSDAFYRQEVLGEYVISNGRQVYSPFSHEANVASLEIVHSLPLLWTLDFNVNPFCTLICQRVGDTLHVVDELVLQGAKTVDMARDMDDRYGQTAHGLVIYGDATGAAEHTSGGSNYKQLLAQLAPEKWKYIHLRVPRRNPPVLERVNLVNGLLETVDKKVRMKIDPRCHWLIADLEAVQFREDGIQVDKSKDARRTHISDALGYLAWEEFGNKQRIGESHSHDDVPGAC